MLQASLCARHARTGLVRASSLASLAQRNVRATPSIPVVGKCGATHAPMSAVAAVSQDPSSIEALWHFISPTSFSDPMVPVLGLAAAQCAMGGFDNIYHHELTERLPWRNTAHDEQALHCMRGGLYTLVFLSFAGVTPTGAFAYGMAGILGVETALTLADFVTEDRTRLLPATERVTHTLLTLNYGALLALWGPILINDWAARPTGIEFVNYGLPTAFNAVCAAGVAAWSVRDYFSVARLKRFAVAEQARADNPVAVLDRPKQRVLVTGGTGFLGTRLCTDLLRGGHDVAVYARDRQDASKFRGVPGKLTIVDSLTDGFARPEDERFDVVFNLAGAPIGEARWNEERIQSFFDSRINTTNALVELIAKMPEASRPRVMVSASAIGYYGVAMGGEVDEFSPPAETDSVSHKLCNAWEEAAKEAEALGVRVAVPRIGVVLGREGGALAKMLTPFEFGMGGPMGSGDQIMPWVHVDDCIAMITAGANGDDSEAGGVRGPYNVTAPNNASNEELTSTLASVMRRPAFMRIPAISLKLLFGSQLADELLLNGQAVLPKVLPEKHGYEFRYPVLRDALQDLVYAKPRDEE